MASLSSRQKLLIKLQAEIRSLLISAAHNGLTVTELMRDYQDLNGRPMPLAELGYREINELLLNDMDGVCTFWLNVQGEITLFPQSHESTRHLEKLIARQRASVKVGRIGGSLQQVAPTPPRRGGPSGYYRRGNGRPARGMVRNYGVRTAQSGNFSSPSPHAVRTPASSNLHNSSNPPPVNVSVARQTTSTNSSVASSAVTPIKTTSVQPAPSPVKVVAAPPLASMSKSSSVRMPSAVVQLLEAAASSASSVEAKQNDLSFSPTVVAPPVVVPPIVPVISAPVPTPTRPNVSSAIRQKILQPRFDVPSLPTPETNVSTVRHTFSPKFSNVSVAPTSSSATFMSTRPIVPTPFQTAKRVTVSRPPMVNRPPTSYGFVSSFNAPPVSNTAPFTTVAQSSNDVNSSQPVVMNKNNIGRQTPPIKNPELYQEIKENVRKMMDKYSRRGVDVTIFKEAYESFCNKRLNVQDIFEMSWRDLLLTMKDVCYITENNIAKPRTGLPNEDACVAKNVATKATLSATTTTPTKPAPDVYKWLSESNAKQPVNGVETKKSKQQSSSVSDRIVPANFVYDVQKFPNEDRDFKVSMLQCNSPVEFFLYYKEGGAADAFDVLRKSLAGYNFDNDEFLISSQDLEIGLACCAYYQVDGWHRVQILAIDVIGEIVTCSFVDFGTVDDVPIKHLRYLPVEFKDVPAQAIKAKMAFIRPPEGFTEFPEETCKRLLSFTSNQVFWARVVPDETTNSVVAVLLTLTNGDNDVHINDQLILENLASVCDSFNQPDPVDATLGNLSLNGAPNDDDICDADFGFDDEPADDYGNKPPSDALTWEDELEAMSDDISVTSSTPSLPNAESANTEENKLAFLLPELETEVQLVKRARTMVSENKATFDSLIIIRTVVVMRRTALYKQISTCQSTSQDIVDKLKWLEEQIRWLDNQVYEPEEPQQVA